PRQAPRSPPRRSTITRSSPARASSNKSTTMTAERVALLRSVWKRRFAKYSRWLHIYVSMASFAIVFFFAATGITLNHAEWFGGADRTSNATGALNAEWTKTGAK